MAIELFNLAGKTALVTGASRGLGQGMAIALAEAGANVAGVGVSDQSATCQAVEAAGRDYLSVRADLADPSSWEQVVGTVNEKYEFIDILVNNAGIIRRNDFLDFEEDDWDDVLDLNLKSMFFMTQAVARRMTSRGVHGRIINVASMLSFQGGVRVPSYTASKSGVRGLTMAMANELAKHGITVNAIAPGYMATDNTEALRADEKRNQEILARIPTGRWGLPADLAGAVIFLASDASAYVTGHTLAVDGGWLAR